MQQADLPQARDLQRRVAGGGGLGQQLHRHREREHGTAVDAMVVEVQVVLEIEGADDVDGAVGRARHGGVDGQQRECPGVELVVGRRSAVHTRGGERGRSADHDLGLALAPEAQLLGEVPAAGVDRDQLHAAPRELLLELRRHHPGRQPRPPVDRHDAGGPAPVEILRELVQDLAGGRVVGLAAIAEAPGDRAEEDEEAERLGSQLARQRVGGAGLRRDHALEAMRAPCRGRACPR